MKACGGPCGSWLSSASFYRDERMRDGLSSWCKDCQRASSRESSRRRHVVRGTMRQARSYDGKFTRAAS